jgi:hypothetical protein
MAVLAGMGMSWMRDAVGVNSARPFFLSRGRTLMMASIPTSSAKSDWLENSPFPIGSSGHVLSQ